MADPAAQPVVFLYVFDQTGEITPQIPPAVLRLTRRELLVDDTSSAPPVALENEARTDFLFED